MNAVLLSLFYKRHIAKRCMNNNKEIQTFSLETIIMGDIELVYGLF